MDHHVLQGAGRGLVCQVGLASGQMVGFGSMKINASIIANRLINPGEVLRSQHCCIVVLFWRLLVFVVVVVVVAAVAVVAVVAMVVVVLVIVIVLLVATAAAATAAVVVVDVDVVVVVVVAGIVFLLLLLLLQWLYVGNTSETLHPPLSNKNHPRDLEFWVLRQEHKMLRHAAVGRPHWLQQGIAALRLRLVKGLPWVQRSGLKV